MKYSTGLLTAVLILVVIPNVKPLNILGLFPYQGKSHFIVFGVHLRALANKGHNVTVVSYFPENKPPKNYYDISLAQTVETLEDSSTHLAISYKSLFDVGFYLANTGIDNCEILLANKEVQKLIKQRIKFDVILMEQFNSDCGLAVAYKLKAPVVATMAHIIMPWHYQRMGIPYNPSYVPFHFLDGGKNPSLIQRVERAVFDILYRLFYRYYTQRINQNTVAKYFDDIPPLEELAREIKFLLINHNFVLTGSRLFPANVIEVGGYHVPKAKPLPKDLETFVQGAEHGVVYISFGSVIKSSTMAEAHLQAILSVMAELPQRFIWKWESKILLADKNKLYVAKWLPQVDILGHPKTVAFISHAGMGGTTEALHYGVPIVAMPVTGDQPANAGSIEDCGLGVHLPVKDLNKENLMSALKQILDPKFRENVKNLRKVWHDRPMPPLDAAIFWTEFAARNANFTFRAPAADVPFYQYINLDIICVLALILILPIVLIKFAISLCCRSKVVEIKKENKKKVKRH